MPAISPRFSLLLPTGSAGKRLTSETTGYELNLPISKQVGDFYLHANAGYLHHPENDLVVPRLAGSGIWRARPMLNLMLEMVAEFVDVTGSREVIGTVSPGLRTGWDIGEAQAVAGVAIPVIFGSGRTEASVFGYFSYELPFAAD